MFAPLNNICEFREWIEFAKIKGAKINICMYEKYFYKLAKIKGANFAKLQISENKRGALYKGFYSIHLQAS